MASVNDPSPLGGETQAGPPMPVAPPPEGTPPEPRARRAPSAWLKWIALGLTLALWPAFKLALGPQSELRVRFAKVGWGLTGQVTTSSRGGPPESRPLTEEDLTQVLEDGIPEGLQEVRIPLPRDSRRAELTLWKMEDRPILEVTWVPLRGSVLSGPGVRPLPFEDALNPDGSRTVRVDRLRPGPWNVDTADLLFGGVTWALAWLLLAARWGEGRAAAFARRQGRWARYAVAPLVAWSLWWLAFFPGILSYDPLIQWLQLRTGQFEDWHPVFHTAYLWLIGGPFGSLAAVGLAQAALFAALLGKALEELEQWRVPAWARWAVVAWASLSPAVSTNVIAAWKDAPFTAACLGTVWVLLRTERRGRLDRASAVALGVFLLCITLLRHNGVVLSVPLLATCAWRYSKDRARWTAALVVVGGVLLVRGPLYSAANVAPPPPELTQVLLLHRLGAVANAPDLTPEEARVLSSLMPLEEWRARYHCDSVAGIVFGSPLDRPGLKGRALELLGLLWDHAKRHPEAMLRHQLCVTRYAWDPVLSTLYIGPFNGKGNTVDPNGVGVKPHSWLPGLRPLLEDFAVGTYAQVGWPRATFWQPAPSVYLCLAAWLALAWRRRGLAALIIFQAVGLNHLAWLLLSPNPDLRFLFPTVLAAPLLLAFALAPGCGAPGTHQVDSSNVAT